MDATSEVDAMFKLREMSDQYNTASFWAGNAKFDDWWVEDQELLAYPVENGSLTIDDLLYTPEEEEEEEAEDDDDYDIIIE